MTISSPSGRDGLGVDLDLAADEQRVVAGERREQLAPGQAGADVDVMVRSQEVDALLGELLRDEDAHRC